MPKYEKEINRLVELEEVEEMIKKAYNEEQKMLLILLYLTGARPSEILELKYEDFTIIDNDLQITLKTKKHGLDRILVFDINSTPYLSQLVLPNVMKHIDKKEFVFSFRTDTRVRQIIYRLSNNKLCPYNFRHNRLSKIGLLGGSLQELMYWKGAKRADSVMPYLYKNPEAVARLKKHIK